MNRIVNAKKAIRRALIEMLVMLGIDAMFEHDVSSTTV
jgi:hypothetical protein